MLFFGRLFICLRFLSSVIVIVCIRFGIAHAQKNSVLVVKNHMVLHAVLHTMRPPPPPPQKKGKNKSGKLFI